MRILIIGYGSVAAKHCCALLKIEPAAEVIALRSSYNAKEIENILSVYTYNDVQLHSPYDFAIISNPTFKHIETIVQLLNLNCPLFIEKPLSDTLECTGVIDKISSIGLITYVACNLRFLDSLVFLKGKLIKDLHVNEVNVYCGSYLPDWRPGTDYKTVYSSDAGKGGGVHLDLIHEIDYVYWLFGKPVSVNLFKSSTSTLDITAIDYANYLMEYSNFAVNIILNYFRKDKKRSIELVCAEGTYTVDLLKNNVTKGDKTLFQSTQDLSDTYLEQMKYFIDYTVIKQEKGTIMNDILEAYEVLKICIQ